MSHRYTLPAHLHAVSAGGQEFHADDKNEVDLEGLHHVYVQQLVDLVGIVPVPATEDAAAAAALAAEKARHAAEVALHTKAAHEAALGQDKQRNEAEQRAREEAAAVLELETLRRSEREAEKAAAPVEPAGFEAPAEETKVVPSTGLVPPSRKKK